MGDETAFSRTGSDFRYNHLLKKLSVALGSTTPPEELDETFLKDPVAAPPQNVSHNTLRVLAHRSPNPEAFIQKYEELHSKQVESLPSFVNLLAQISQDKKLREYLNYKAGRAARAASASTSVPSSSGTAQTQQNVEKNVFKEQLPEIIHRVRKAATPFYKSTGHNVLPPKKHKDADKKLRHPNYVAPVVPDRTKLRPNISLDFAEEHLVPSPLNDIPVYSQENKLMEDLLFVLCGLQGEYIAAHPLLGPYEARTFALGEGVDKSLKQLVQTILPLASCYSVVVRFIEEKSLFEYGQVNQALAGTMRLLVNEYQLFLAQLEVHVRTENMNLQAFWFYCQPTYRTMEILANIGTAISKAGAHGGKVLSLLHDFTTSIGDPKFRNQCLLLTQAASVPYMEILQKWVYKGVIEDPYDEFLVEDNEVIQKEEVPVNYSDDYWEKRYIIRRDKIPVFLEKIAVVILRTGKYLNVIRQCGKNVKAPQAREIRYTLVEREYFEAIEHAYHFASQTLLDLLMKENDLMGRLRSVKHYFLHSQGDFIVQLMDMCEGELSKNINDIVPHRLETLLELALRTSTANSDQYKDDMRAELLPYDLTHQMLKIHGTQNIETQETVCLDKLTLIGLESFSIGYEVKWPVSLVLTRKTKACYQMIFRHLFYCKHVERLLCRVWLSNKVCKTFPVLSSQCYRPAFILRQRMLNCVQNLQYYMMVEVIEPNWHTFLEKMSKVTDVEEVLVIHSDFLCVCMKDCMLANVDLLHIVNRLVAACVDFCRFFQAAPSLEGPTSSEGESFEKSISNLDMQFSTALIGLLNKIEELATEDSYQKMLNVLYRLDFNSFYSRSLLQSLGGLEGNTASVDVPQTSG